MEIFVVHKPQKIFQANFQGAQSAAEARLRRKTVSDGMMGIEWYIIYLDWQGIKENYT